MPFRRGQSGNPSGRPKMAQQIRDFARAACPKAIETLIAQLDHPDPRIAANAADKLLDRGVGKPMQAHEVIRDEAARVEHRAIDVNDWLDEVAEDLKLVTWPPKDRE